jgi:arylsulfatase A-like enzyme
VFILTDNLGYGEVGCYGGGVTRGAATPRIDSLAKEGMKNRPAKGSPFFARNGCRQ